MHGTTYLRFMIGIHTLVAYRSEFALLLYKRKPPDGPCLSFNPRAHGMCTSILMLVSQVASLAATPCPPAPALVIRPRPLCVRCLMLYELKMPTRHRHSLDGHHHYLALLLRHVQFCASTSSCNARFGNLAPSLPPQRQTTSASSEASALRFSVGLARAGCLRFCISQSGAHAIAG